MKRTVVVGLLVVALSWMGLSNFGRAGAASLPSQVPLKTPATQRLRRTITEHAATAALQAQLAADQKHITAHIAYKGQEKVVSWGPFTLSMHTKRIRAVEVMVNGTTRQVHVVNPPAKQGTVDLSVDISSLSQSERTRPLQVAAKTYSEVSHPHSSQPKPKRLAATSNTMIIAWPSAPSAIVWTPQPWQLSALAGTTQTSAIGLMATQKFDNASIQVSPELADMVVPDISGEQAIEAGTAYKLPFTIQPAAAKPAGTYNGTISLYVAGKAIGQAAVQVAVTHASKDIIPGKTNVPSADRLTIENNETFAKDELIVGLDMDMANADQRIKDIAAQTGGVITGSIPALHNYQLQFEGLASSGLEAKRAQLAALPNVDFVAHHFVSPATVAIPNDPGYPPATWQTNGAQDTNWGLKYIEAPKAWDITTGNPSTPIGVIDIDFDALHEDLKENVPNAGPGYPTDNDSGKHQNHGNHVAGTACATGNNGKGIAGVSWRCSMNWYGYGGTSAESSELAAQKMQEAASDGMRIVNMSLQWVDNNQCVRATPETIRYVEEYNKIFGRSITWAKKHNKDVLWVFAAGNECRDVRYASPASLVYDYPENTVSVAAITRDGTLAHYPATVFPSYPERGSNFGAGVSVAAPGVDIFSTTGRFCLPGKPANTCTSLYDEKGGTSMAAPYVSGLAGLVLSAHSNFSAAQIKTCIVDAANGYGKVVPGYSFKAINAPEAVKCQKNAADCIFERGVRPDGCESTNPTVQVDFFKTSACAQKVRLTWDRDNPAVMQEFNIADLAPGAARTLGQHTYSTPGDHWINEDVIGADGKSCLFVALDFLFRLKTP